MKKGDKFIDNQTGELIIFDNCNNGEWTFDRLNTPDGQKKYWFWTFNPWPEFVTKVK